MLSLKELKWNLGLPQLLPEWKKIFSTEYLMADLASGITVAFIAIPLSLAIALASGVPPGIGLITAIIAGIVCSLFGGTPLSVSGPAAAMSVLIADLVEKFGLSSLILICALAGLMQLASGILGLGRLGRYVPLPVIAGFTAGIGVIILIGQLPRVFGLMPPPESDIFSVFSHLKHYLHAANLACVFIVILTITIIYSLPKLWPRVPSILSAVIITSLIVYFCGFSNVPLIGAIPDTLPSPHIPSLTSLTWKELLFNSFVIYLLASLETLLSSSAVDKLAKGKKHDADQELIGQGLGNIAVSLFGGIPITGVIARSAANVRSGAKTRRSSLIHSLIILLVIFFASSLISAIPIASLAGVLFTVAISMINVKEFYYLLKKAYVEAIIFATTFLTIIFVDLLAGVQAGIIAACLIVLARSTKTHLHISVSTNDDVVRLSLVGALTFLSTAKIANLQKKLGDNYQHQTVLMDLSNIRNVDMTGASAIIELFQYCQSKQIYFYIKGLPRRFESLFRLCDGSVLLDEWYLVSEHDLRNKAGAPAPKSSYGRLVHGFQRFYIQRQHDDKRLFETISNKQDPHTLFITCSDSRIIPSLITSADPGELFIIRNIGNYIPPHHSTMQSSEAAAVEFALRNFDITDVVVCGHANCGAMKACQAQDSEHFVPEIAYWINKIKAQLTISAYDNVNELARANVIKQIDNLKHYPIIKQKLINHSLHIHAWFYNFEESLIYEWSHHHHDFISIVPELSPHLEQA